jgi:hypothetical protein
VEVVSKSADHLWFARLMSLFRDDNGVEFAVLQWFLEVPVNRSGRKMSTRLLDSFDVLTVDQIIRPVLVVRNYLVDDPSEHIVVETLFDCTF